MNNDDFKLYLLAVLAYKKEHPEITEEDLFPVVWYESNNYKMKTEIITLAIEEKKLITELNEFQELIDNL